MAALAAAASALAAVAAAAAVATVVAVSAPTRCCRRQTRRFWKPRETLSMELSWNRTAEENFMRKNEKMSMMPVLKICLSPTYLGGETAYPLCFTCEELGTPTEKNLFFLFSCARLDPPPALFHYRESCSKSGSLSLSPLFFSLSLPPGSSFLVTPFPSSPG